LFIALQTQTIKHPRYAVLNEDE